MDEKQKKFVIGLMIAAACAVIIAAGITIGKS